MPTLADARIAALLGPYLTEGEGGPLVVAPDVIEKLSAYLDLLLRWNAKTNLTAIREPEAIVQRHFGESLFVARHLSGFVQAGRIPPAAELLDFGAGAGFPGLPIQLALPDFRVTLAESQNKKAAFLREAVRTLALTAEVWSSRVEDMPAGRRFDVVALRAVDNMESAVLAARQKVRSGGFLAELMIADGKASPAIRYPLPAAASQWSELRLFHVEQSSA